MVRGRRDEPMLALTLQLDLSLTVQDSLKLLLSHAL
jgi:hypothetical protein